MTKLQFNPNEHARVWSRGTQYDRNGLHNPHAYSSLPERSWDGVLELEPAGLAVDLERHDVDGGVVELDPGELAAVGAEPEGARVRDHLLLVHPVGDPVEHGPGDA